MTTLRGMNPGRLDRRISLRVKTVANDASGEEIETWAELDGVWAMVTIGATSEAHEAAQDHATEETEFLIRYRTDITVNTLNEIAYDGKTYDISGVEEVGRREYLRITALARRLP